MSDPLSRTVQGAGAPARDAAGRPVWAQRQTITDFEHAVAAKHLRHGRADLLRPVADAVTGEEVETRSLGVYDTALGLVDVADGEVG